MALRKADAVLAQRAAAIREHEDALRDVLAGYFRARDGADTVRAKAEAAAQRVRRDAEARITLVRERAERDAAGFEEQARAAVRRMLELGESVRAIAVAIGVPVVRVRAAGKGAPVRRT